MSVVQFHGQGLRSFIRTILKIRTDSDKSAIQERQMQAQLKKTPPDKSKISFLHRFAEKNYQKIGQFERNKRKNAMLTSKISSAKRIELLITIKTNITNNQITVLMAQPQIVCPIDRKHSLSCSCVTIDLSSRKIFRCFISAAC